MIELSIEHFQIKTELSLFIERTGKLHTDKSLSESCLNQQKIVIIIQLFVLIYQDDSECDLTVRRRQVLQFIAR